MPYIKQKDRARLDLGNEIAVTAGELNFQITTKITEYLTSKGTSYQSINDIVGALECAKLEFSRRIVTPFENAKIAENGDVY